MVVAEAFTGIMRESGMLSAMARATVGDQPPELAGHVPFALGLTAIPRSLVFDADSFSFGMLSVVADVAGGHGVPQVQVR
jgi:CitMHS family citrate-Mg2+:H+ or citrate-Ca2+:H+ symporter